MAHASPPSLRWLGNPSHAALFCPGSQGSSGQLAPRLGLGPLGPKWVSGLTLASPHCAAAPSSCSHLLAAALSPLHDGIAPAKAFLRHSWKLQALSVADVREPCVSCGSGCIPLGVPEPCLCSTCPPLQAPACVFSIPAFATAPGTAACAQGKGLVGNTEWKQALVTLAGLQDLSL